MPVVRGVWMNSLSSKVLGNRCLEGAPQRNLKCYEWDRVCSASPESVQWCQRGVMKVSVRSMPIYSVELES